MSEAPWWRHLSGDPSAFLLDEGEPGAMWRVLVEALGRPVDSPAVLRAKRASREIGAAARLLASQSALGYWGSPATYGARWSGSVWHVIALAELGADPEDPRVARGAETLIEMLQPPSGGFAAARGRPPAACFTAEVCAALVRLGFGHHPRLREALAWLAARDQGRGPWSCPELRHLVRGGCPVAAVAVLRLAGEQAGGEGCAFEPLARRAAGWLLECRLFLDEPSPRGWHAYGHPTLAHADLLDALAALARLGWSVGPEIRSALVAALARQDEHGCWRQRAHVVFGEAHGEPSRWLTLKALVALAAYGEKLEAGEAV
ncbi:MAG: hypothetical protein V1750_05595 [Acidobacteriota bacterium]